MKVNTSILLLLMIAIALPSFGGNGNGNGTDSLQATRYVTRATMYGVGYTNVFDTYLSPQEYKGIEFRISRETMRMTAWGDGNVSVQNFFQANLAYTHNRVDNNNTFAGLVNWNYGLHYQFRITDSFKLLAGGMGDINLDASGMAIWHTKIKNYPLALRYQVNLPVIGVMFSPHYGQSYYEIFTLGHASGVVRFTSLHNQPALRQMISVDFPIRYTKMRLSYLCDLQQSKLNGIKTHTYSQVFMVGFVHDLFRIRNKNGTPLPPAVRAY